jgi:hypothetical protein
VIDNLARSNSAVTATPLACSWSVQARSAGYSMIPLRRPAH